MADPSDLDAGEHRDVGGRQPDVHVERFESFRRELDWFGPAFPEFSSLGPNWDPVLVQHGTDVGVLVEGVEEHDRWLSGWP